MDDNENIYSEQERIEQVFLVDEKVRANAIDSAYKYLQKKADLGIQFKDGVVVFLMFFAGGVLGYFLHYLFTLNGIR